MKLNEAPTTCPATADCRKPVSQFGSEQTTPVSQSLVRLGRRRRHRRRRRIWSGQVDYC